MKKIFRTGPTRAAKAGQNLLYRHEEPNERTKVGPPSFVLFESPFASVSKVSMGTYPIYFQGIWQLLQTKTGEKKRSLMPVDDLYRLFGQQSRRIYQYIKKR